MDPLIALDAWFRADGLFANFWIPAFAGMTGENAEKGSADCARRLVSGGWVVRGLLDSRFRGNDGGRNREWQGEKSLGWRG